MITKYKRPLFEFELTPIEKIEPWGEAPNLSLHWFALTDGIFRINLGKDILFRYSKEISHHWNLQNRDSDYQIAAFARDFLGSTTPALNYLPHFLHPLAWNWELLREVVIQSREHDSHYDAFRWLGERSPWTSYLNANPEISFIRKENNILIGWDNRSCIIDDLPVWEADFGCYIISVDDYVNECQSFVDRLLNEMLIRIQKIASGEYKSLIPIDPKELLKQHETWQKEFNGYLNKSTEPDIPWEETRIALDKILVDLKKTL
jgi:Family of unknown function (DUF5984)